MYGFFHSAWADMVVSKYGEAVWQQIVEEAGVTGGGSFLPHKNYDDDQVMEMFVTSANILGIEQNECFEIFGKHFLAYCIQCGYERVLRVLGSNLSDFFCNLDSLHEHLDSVYPGMQAPQFRCSPSEDGGLNLHYQSSRYGLYPMVIGMVKAVSETLFDIKVMVEPVHRTECYGDQDHVVLHVREQNACELPRRPRSCSLAGLSGAARYKASSRPKDLSITVEIFCKAFPFHVMFNRAMQIVQAGWSIIRVLKLKPTTEKLKGFNDVFTVIRPVINNTFQSVLSQINAIFVVHARLPTLYSQGTIADYQGAFLRLKGQMLLVPESDCILFLCSPRVPDLDELKNRGLFLSDIPLHDSTRDLLLISQARRHERELVEKLEESGNNLKNLQSQLQKDKEKTDELLQSILPSSVVERLRLNLPVEAEKFNLVTILLSDIVGFTAMCGDEKIVPIDIVRMLNRLYTQFDLLSKLNGVYKVETIGDAYLVVGGLPVPTVYHADRVISMAFGMIDASDTVLSPVDRNPIQIRIGVHSGPCLAGVVGRMMPRYCLFGNTVAVASAMESSSQPGRVNISMHAKSHLTNPMVYLFEENVVHGEVGVSYFIYQTPASPRPTLDRSLPVPRGMFRTPNPSPPGSREASPGEGTPADSPFHLPVRRGSLLAENTRLFQMPMVCGEEDSHLQTSPNPASRVSPPRGRQSLVKTTCHTREPTLDNENSITTDLGLILPQFLINDFSTSSADPMAADTNCRGYQLPHYSVERTVEGKLLTKTGASSLNQCSFSKENNDVKKVPSRIGDKSVYSELPTDLNNAQFEKNVHRDNNENKCTFTEQKDHSLSPVSTASVDSVSPTLMAACAILRRCSDSCIYMDSPSENPTETKYDSRTEIQCSIYDKPTTNIGKVEDSSESGRKYQTDIIRKDKLNELGNSALYTRRLNSSPTRLNGLYLPINEAKKGASSGRLIVYFREQRPPSRLTADSGGIRRASAPTSPLSRQYYPNLKKQ